MSGTISGTTISSITRGQGSTTGSAHSNSATIELYMINSVPLTEINKTHTAIANIGIDSYTVSTTSASITSRYQQYKLVEHLYTLLKIIDLKQSKH